MTMMPCERCGGFPCRCTWNAPQVYPQWSTWTGTLMPMTQRLSDEDVERIARRVVELLNGPSQPAVAAHLDPQTKLEAHASVHDDTIAPVLGG